MATPAGIVDHLVVVLALALALAYLYRRWRAKPAKGCGTCGPRPAKLMHIGAHRKKNG